MKNINLTCVLLLIGMLVACGGSSGGESGSSSSFSSQSSALSVSSNSNEVGSSFSENGSSSTVSVSSAKEASSSSGVNSSSSASSSVDYSGPIGNDCVTLATNPNVNWRDTSLQTDQEIVKCLSQTLGRAVGYGENALGGYDPNGNSKLTIITTSDAKSVEQQIKDAITGNEHNWIVFDKFDFAEEHEIALHRLWCSNSAVLSRIGGTEEECVDYRSWCSTGGYNDHGACMDEFFNNRLDEKSLVIRNPIIGSNTTIDGRMSNAYFRFMGFAIGGDSSGTPTQTSTSVIITHLDFRGAGHTEDHGLDPDMIRNTGASQDIWIHKNTFDLTGDSAFDVKVGARSITMSFNKVVDVVRASLHGSSDSRTINANITTTMHHNAFFTRDERYKTFGNTGRRVPLVRRGKSHMFNNVFTNYRKDVLNARAGGSVLFEDNVFLVNQIHQEKSDINNALNELKGNLLRDIRTDSHLRVEGSHLWFAEGTCKLVGSTKTDLSESSTGTVADLSLSYSEDSQAMIQAIRSSAGQELVDYVDATAGRDGELPFNSPLAGDIHYVLGLDRCSGEPSVDGDGEGSS